MIKMSKTLMGSSYNHYMASYLDGIARGFFETYIIHETSLLGVNRVKGQLPKTNLPYVVANDDPRNTHDKTIVLVDLAGLRDTEADLRYVNAILTSVWEDPLIKETFTGTRKFATKAYMNWIGRGLKSRFNFSFEDQSELNILLAIYYYCSVGKVAEILDTKNYKAYADLAEITGLGALRITQVVSKFNLMYVEDEFYFDMLIERMTIISDDTRTKVSIQSIMSSLANSWYGEGGVFYCNLALEYPPMFLSLLYFSLMDKTYTQTRFGKVVSEFSVGRNRGVGELFTRQLHSQIKAFKLTPQ